MRVITGTARGRRLETLAGNDIRPTTDRVKEALFSSIQFDIEGRRILDLFSGSGQLGIEALSRGAKSATFVDISPDSIEITRRNIASTGFAEKSKTFRKDWFSFIAGNSEKFDIAFLDPPYKIEILSDALQKVSGIMSDFGVIICEHPLNDDLPQSVDNSFILHKKLISGKIAISIYRKERD